MRAKVTIWLAAAVGLWLLTTAGPLRAQSSGGITLWVDQSSGQVFVRPGRNRVPLKLGGDTGALEQQMMGVQQRVDQVQASVAETKAQQQADTEAMAKQVDEIKPAWKSYMDNFQNKFRLGALSYLDYGLYTHTGFGPQFLENLNPPGVGNDDYNSFDVNRVYLNTYFTPTKDTLFRFTPELYRANGTASNDTTGKVTGFGTNLDGDMNVRMKYAYLQYSGFDDNVPQLKGGNVQLGADPNPFIPWEEDLYGFRYVNLVPWNYMGLSSSQIGLQTSGPVHLGDPEVTNLEYGFGVYDQGNFHSQQQANTPQTMEKLTYYPFGAKWRFQGLGLTAFYNYGWGNVAPDSTSVPTTLKVANSSFDRFAAVVHYAAEEWNVAGEFDYGKNAFTVSNLYSGSGPKDAFGTATGTPFTTGSHFGNTCTAASPCYPVEGTYGPQVAVYQSMLNQGKSEQLGFDMFGHYHIPGTKLTAFGLFQWLLPNDKANPDPLDFQRFAVGLNYQLNEYVRFALDTQDVLFYHNNFGLTTQQAFGYPPSHTLNGWQLPTIKSDTFIPNLVPRDIHSFFLNVEFAY